MGKITLDCSQSCNLIEYAELEALQEKIDICHRSLHNRSGAGSGCLGWLELPVRYDSDELERIKAAAERIRDDSDVLVVVGIGGSYIGARAGIEMMGGSFYNELPRELRKGPRVYFAGNNISSSYLKNLIHIIGDQDISLNVISKSGTTTEPAIAFRLLKEYMEERYGKAEASARIYVTTDRDRGALKEMADQEGYESFVIPDDVGGRYSVLTPVGLLPMAAAGIDLDEVMAGSRAAYGDLMDTSIEMNHAYSYAALRNILYSRGKNIEIMASYEPSLYYFGEWYRQLFAESEGKDGKGIFPAISSFTTDLHSVGQYVQEGRKNIFETILNVEDCGEEIIIGETEDNMDGLNYLCGRTLDYVNGKAMEGTIMAHVDGGVPNLVINVPEISPYYFGYMVYFFQKACAMSGYLLGVNPFDQPGVEAYKNNMFRLLGKPGY